MYYKDPFILQKENTGLKKQKEVIFLYRSSVIKIYFTYVYTSSLYDTLKPSTPRKTNVTSTTNRTWRNRFE